jgi:hypothetical protein
MISPAVTPYHLLTTPRVSPTRRPGSATRTLFVTEPNYSFSETADHLLHFVTKPPNFAPGEGCRYCNVGYLLLGWKPYQGPCHVGGYVHVGW